MRAELMASETSNEGLRGAIKDDKDKVKLFYQNRFIILFK